MDIGRGTTPVWCHPRRRDETGRPPRASHETGTRRTPVRWHQPTAISGSNRRILLAPALPMDPLPKRPFPGSNRAAHFAPRS
jgi:hypothetical protein